MSIPQNHADAAAMLTGRCANSRKVANNTYLQRREGDVIALKLHQTDVVTFHPNGMITLNSGGWHTVTTKDRFNSALSEGFKVFSDRGRWFLYRWDSSTGWNKVAAYADDLTLDPVTGVVVGAEDDATVSAEDKANAKMKRDVARFVRKITPERIVQAWENSDGDCFLCKFGQTSCLAEHVEDNYFHASLAYRAVEARGYRDPALIMSMIYSAAQREHVDPILKDSLRKYLRKNLTVGAVAAA